MLNKKDMFSALTMLTFQGGHEYRYLAQILAHIKTEYT